MMISAPAHPDRVVLAAPHDLLQPLVLVIDESFMLEPVPT
jgi:hypothetical protein